MARNWDSEFYGIVALSYTRDELKRLYVASFNSPRDGKWKAQIAKAREDFKRGVSDR